MRQRSRKYEITLGKRRLAKRGCVTAVQFILFNFANCSPVIAMELNVSKEITYE